MNTRDVQLHPSLHPEGNAPLKHSHNVRLSFDLHSIKKVQIFHLLRPVEVFVGTMAYRGQGQKVQKVMVQPIVSFFFNYVEIQTWFICCEHLSLAATR